jgi:small subunit ribosomal protein S2
VTARVPVVAICDTFNETRDVDVILPANNKGKKALATLFWLLARQTLKERGEIKTDKEFKYKIEDFEKEE